MFQAIVFQLSLNFADILLKKNFQRNRGPVSFFSKHIRTFDIKKDKLICQISCFSYQSRMSCVGTAANIFTQVASKLIYHKFESSPNIRQ